MSRREELENSMYYKSTVTVDMRVFIGAMLRDISVSLADHRGRNERDP